MDITQVRQKLHDHIATEVSRHDRDALSVVLGQFEDAVDARLQNAEELLDILIDAHYGMSLHDIGNGDGIPQDEADRIREYIKSYGWMSRR